MPAPPDTNLTLDRATETRLQRLAEARHRAPDQLMREAIEQYVEREEARDNFRRDALAAWADYQATGRYVAASLADAWLARLESGEYVEPPPALR